MDNSILYFFTKADYTYSRHNLILAIPDKKNDLFLVRRKLEWKRIDVNQKIKLSFDKCFFPVESDKSEEEDESEESEDDDVFVPKEFVEIREDDVQTFYCIEEEVGR